MKRPVLFLRWCESLCLSLSWPVASSPKCAWRAPPLPLRPLPPLPLRHLLHPPPLARRRPGELDSEAIRHIQVQVALIQGDHSACGELPVDFKTKVPLWPG